MLAVTVKMFTLEKGQYHLAFIIIKSYLCILDRAVLFNTVVTKSMFYIPLNREDLHKMDLNSQPQRSDTGVIMSTTCPLGLYFNAVTIPLINLYTQKHKIANRTTKPLIVHRETETMSSPQGSGGDIQQTPIMIEHLKNYKKCHHRKPA